MTDAEIIKVLECCSEHNTFCNGCSYKHNPIECCDSDLCKDAVALINRLRNTNNALEGLCQAKQAEIEELQEENQKLHKICNRALKTYKETKSEAIKEFWEKTKKTREYRTCPYVYVIDGDNLAKEMTEQ